MGSSEKITGAMKMISSAKMHKAEGALGRLLPYRNQIQTVIGHLLSADAQFTSPLLEAREVKRVALVVLGSATPSIESMYHAQRGDYALYTLRARYNQRPLPGVTIADSKQDLREGNNTSIGAVLQQESDETL